MTKRQSMKYIPDSFRKLRDKSRYFYCCHQVQNLPFALWAFLGTVKTRFRRECKYYFYTVIYENGRSRYSVVEGVIVNRTCNNDATVNYPRLVLMVQKTV